MKQMRKRQNCKQTVCGMAGGVSVFAKILDKLQIDRGSGVMYDVHDLMLYDAGK